MLFFLLGARYKFLKPNDLKNNIFSIKNVKIATLPLSTKATQRVARCKFRINAGFIQLSLAHNLFKLIRKNNFLII